MSPKTDRTGQIWSFGFAPYVKFFLVISSFERFHSCINLETGEPFVEEEAVYPFEECEYLNMRRLT